MKKGLGQMNTQGEIINACDACKRKDCYHCKEVSDDWKRILRLKPTFTLLGSAEPKFISPIKKEATNERK